MYTQSQQPPPPTYPQQPPNMPPQYPPPQEKPYKREPFSLSQFILNNLLTWILELIAIVLLILYLLRIFVMQDYLVSGRSMESSIHDGQRLIVNTWSYAFSPPQRGDVVVLIPPEKVSENYVKRIIGLPGETVEIRGDNQIIIYNDEYLNGIRLIEPYIDEKQKTLAEIREKLKPDEFFVLGDNRLGSSDSRGNINDIDTVWHLPKQNIVGKALFIVNPNTYLISIGPVKIPRLEYIPHPEYNL